MKINPKYKIFIAKLIIRKSILYLLMEMESGEHNSSLTENKNLTKMSKNRVLNEMASRRWLGRDSPSRFGDNGAVVV